jgi:hypothetical protein
MSENARPDTAGKEDQGSEKESQEKHRDHFHPLYMHQSEKNGGDKERYRRRKTLLKAPEDNPPEKNLFTEPGKKTEHQESENRAPGKNLKDRFLKLIERIPRIRLQTHQVKKIILNDGQTI